MGYVTIDSDDHLVFAARRVGVADARAVRSMLARVDERLAAGDAPIALVYDAGDNPVGRPDAPARSVGGEWFRERADVLRRRCAGFDFAFPSALSRGAITAVFWIASPPVPYTMHATCLEALARAIARVHGRADPRALLAALDDLEQRARPR